MNNYRNNEASCCFDVQFLILHDIVYSNTINSVMNIVRKVAMSNRNTLTLAVVNE